MAKISFLNFWPDFNESHANYFKRMLNGLIVKDVNIVSLFPRSLELPPLPCDTAAHWIAFSGESHSYPFKHFDANLVMEVTSFEEKVVAHPLFSMYAYLGNYWEMLSMCRTPIKKEHFATIVVSNPSGRERNLLFNMLCMYKPVHSWGSWMNNTGKKLPNDVRWSNLFSKYKFMICFENMLKSYYLTEKLLHAYISGAVPIYAGATVAPKWLNPNAFIYVDDFSKNGLEHLLEKIIELDNDEDKYNNIYVQPLLKDKCVPHEMSTEHFRSLLLPLLMRH